MGSGGWMESGSGRGQRESAAASVGSAVGPGVNSDDPWRESSGLLL